jgi:hypothetical protein
VTYTTGSAPRSLFAADLNNDGKLDLAVANSRSDSAGALLGAGDGTFGPGTTFAVSSRAYSIAVAYFNNDGNPDLVSVGFGSSSMSVLLGNGDGTFGDATSYSVPGQPVAVHVADLNGDGIPDLVAADFGTGAVDILLGQGDGTLQASRSRPAAPTPSFCSRGRAASALPVLAQARVVTTLGPLLDRGSAPTHRAGHQSCAILHGFARPAWFHSRWWRAPRSGII